MDQAIHRSEGRGPSQALAFLLAVASAGLANGVGWTALILLEAVGRGGPEPFALLFQMVLRSLIVILIAALLIAPPVTWLLHRSRSEHWLAYLLAGWAAGTMFMPAFTLFGSSGIAWTELITPRILLDSAVRGGVPGALFGLFWWYFGRRPMLEKEDQIG